MPEQGYNYKILHIFFKMIKQTKKLSSFDTGAAWWMFCIYICWNHLIWAFAARILWKIQTFDIFTKVRLANAPQVATMMVLWKMIIAFHSSSWNFSSPHDVTYIVHQNLQKYMEKVTSKVLFPETGWENINFFASKKETFIFNGRSSSSLVDIIFLCTFLL